MIKILAADDMWVIESLEHNPDSVRLVIIERDEQTGMRSVKDIIECPKSAWRIAARCMDAKSMAGCRTEDGTIVDFGRKTALESQMRHVLMEVMK